MSEVFLDTNVLLYAFNEADPRREIARELLRRGTVISAQCLNEFVSVGCRKLGMSMAHAIEAVDAIVDAVGEVLPLDLELHRQAQRLTLRHQLSFYDALIVAAALRANCTTLLTEDMQHGLVIDGRLRLANPFAPA